MANTPSSTSIPVDARSWPERPPLALSIIKPSLVRGSEANSKLELGLIGCGGRGGWIADLF